MPGLSIGTGLSIGELARRCRVSVRALRLYEAEGLLRPARSLAGRRCYGAEDLARMHQVLVLKRAGWTLAQIAALLRKAPADPARLLDVQIALIERRAAELDLALRGLRAARTRLASGESLSVELLCDLITAGEQDMTEQAWGEVFAKYYSEADLVRWREAKAATSAPEQEDYARRWAELIGRVEAAIAAGVKPTEAAAMAMAREWQELAQTMVQKVGAETWNKTATMYQEMDQWQTETVKAPFSAEVYAYISAAAAAARGAAG